MLKSKRKVLFLVPDDITFLIQRLVMAKGVLVAGYDVHVASEDTGHRSKLIELGFKYHKQDLNRGGLNPFSDLIPFIKLVFFLRSLRPEILQCVSIKPVIYGAIAGRFAGLKNIVCLVNGLGFAFDGQGLKGKIVKSVAQFLYRLALSYSGVRVIFQNPEDRDFFVQNNLIAKEKTFLIRGSGVDMEKFKASELPINSVPTVLFVGRLLWNKGVRELLEAARVLKSEGLSFRLIIVGGPDEKNPGAVPQSYLEQFNQEGIIEWVGRQTDMPRFYREADIVCLPTQYKEGLPLTLLEAASTGRALIASDVPGCREIVRHGINGFLVPPSNAIELASAIRALVADRDLTKTFGAASTRIVKEEFSAQIVQSQLVSLYNSLLNDSIGLNGDRTHA